MTIDEVVNYVLYTPHNTNRAILTSMLKQLILDNGGNPDGPEAPDTQDIVYDGGLEK